MVNNNGEKRNTNGLADAFYILWQTLEFYAQINFVFKVIQSVSIYKLC